MNSNVKCFNNGKFQDDVPKFCLFLDLWNVSSTVETKQIRDDSVSGKSSIWTTIKKNGFSSLDFEKKFKFRSFQSSNTKTTINEVQSYQICTKETTVARKQYNFRVIFKELSHVLRNWSTVSISLSLWSSQTVLYLRPFGYY